VAPLFGKVTFSSDGASTGDWAGVPVDRGYPDRKLTHALGLNIKALIS